MDKRRRWAVRLFTVYAVIMFFLLFARNRYNPDRTYWDQFWRHLSLRPFKTTALFWNALTSGEPRLILIGLTNLLGNVLMFIPLGFFPPIIWEKQNRFWKIMRNTALIISTVELLQLVLLVGTCDIDDLMLNLIGAAIGYGIYKWMEHGGRTAQTLLN